MKQFIKKAIKYILKKMGLLRTIYIHSNDKEYVLPDTPANGKLSGQNAFVTGASGAIGRAITAILISKGATVHAVGRNKEKLQLMEKEMNNLSPGSCKICIANLENEEELCTAVQESLGENQKADIWVNCAGGSARSKAAPISTQCMEVIDDVINSNLRLCIIGSKVAATHMCKQGKGRIINISSAIANQGKSAFSDYAAAKAGIIGFSRSLALEVGPQGITVNCVSPGFIQRGAYNDQQKDFLLRSNCMHAIGTPEDVAHAVLFLASPQAGFITGQNILVDGGRSLGLIGDR